jgi:DNA-binding MarR family transcriptional regulator
MFKTGSPAAGKLIDALMRFRTLQHHHKPVGGLRQSEFWLLATLKKAEYESAYGIRVSDLAERLDVATPTATQMVIRLEKAGYVKRQRSTQDKRTVLLVLTEKGSGYMENAHKQFVRRFEAAVKFLGKEDSEKLAELLNRMSEFMKDYVQSETR